MQNATVEDGLNYAHDCTKISPDTFAAIKQARKQPLKAPPQPRGSQKIIKPKELEKILAAAKSPFDRALVLVGLNAALYPIDFHRLRWEYLDLDDGLLDFSRSKKNTDDTEGTIRYATLWNRTVGALRRLEQERKGNFVFMASEDGPVHPDTIYDHFTKLVESAGIKRNLTTCNLRDSAATIASQKAPYAQYRVLMGHSLTAEDDAYIVQGPSFVADACGAIENHYFGGKRK